MKLTLVCPSNLPLLNNLPTLPEDSISLSASSRRGGSRVERCHGAVETGPLVGGAQALLWVCACAPRGAHQTQISPSAHTIALVQGGAVGRRCLTRLPLTCAFEQAKLHPLPISQTLPHKDIMTWKSWK